MTRRKVIVVALIACLLLGGAAIAAMTLFGARTTPGGAPVTPSPTATTATTTAPKAEEVDSLGAALGSGSADSLRPYLAVEATEQLDSGFTQGVHELGLVLDRASQLEAAPGVWSIQATDRTGKEWEVGLTRDGEQLIVIYAEASR